MHLSHCDYANQNHVPIDIQISKSRSVIIYLYRSGLTERLSNIRHSIKYLVNAVSSPANKLLNTLAGHTFCSHGPSMVPRLDQGRFVIRLHEQDAICDTIESALFQFVQIRLQEHT